MPLTSIALWAGLWYLAQKLTLGPRVGYLGHWFARCVGAYERQRSVAAVARSYAHSRCLLATRCSDATELVLSSLQLAHLRLSAHRIHLLAVQFATAATS